MLLTGAILAALPAAAADRAPRVIGGQPVERSESIAAQTALLKDVPQDETCSAWAFASDLFVTAAHCLVDIDDVWTNPIDLRIELGVDGKAPDAGLSVLDYAVPGSFAQRYRNKDEADIALVRTSAGLPSPFHPVQLLPGDAVISAGQVMTLAGYGMTQDSVDDKRRVLKKVMLPVLDPGFSATEFLVRQTFTQAICNGDSGGPVYATVGGELFLAGVISRFSMFGGCSSNLVAIRIQAYRDWLDRAAGALRAIAAPGLNWRGPIRD